MTTLNANEAAQWNKILEDASLQLIIGHSERRTLEAERFENSLLSNKDISRTERLELKEYESRKEEDIMKQKIKKMQRDNVLIPEYPTIEPLSEAGGGCSEPLGEPGGGCSESETSPESSAHPGSNVVNLSDVPLLESELKLLSKGLTFCPSTGKLMNFSCTVTWTILRGTCAFGNTSMTEKETQKKHSREHQTKVGHRAMTATNILICTFRPFKKTC